MTEKRDDVSAESHEWSHALRYEASEKGRH